MLSIELCPRDHISAVITICAPIIHMLNSPDVAHPKIVCSNSTSQHIFVFPVGMLGLDPAKVVS